MSRLSDQVRQILYLGQQAEGWSTYGPASPASSTPNVGINEAVSSGPGCWGMDQDQGRIPLQSQSASRQSVGSALLSSLILQLLTSPGKAQAGSTPSGTSHAASGISKHPHPQQDRGQGGQWGEGGGEGASQQHTPLPHASTPASSSLSCTGSNQHSSSSRTMERGAGISAGPLAASPTKLLSSSGGALGGQVHGWGGSAGLCQSSAVAARNPIHRSAGSTAGGHSSPAGEWVGAGAGPGSLAGSISRSLSRSTRLQRSLSFLPYGSPLPAYLPPAGGAWLDDPPGPSQVATSSHPHQQTSSWCDTGNSGPLGRVEGEGPSPAPDRDSTSTAGLGAFFTAHHTPLSSPNLALLPFRQPALGLATPAPLPGSGPGMGAAQHESKPHEGGGGWGQVQGGGGGAGVCATGCVTVQRTVLKRQVAELRQEVQLRENYLSSSEQVSDELWHRMQVGTTHHSSPPTHIAAPGGPHSSLITSPTSLLNQVID